jgi:hypothetical protein
MSAVVSFGGGEVWFTNSRAWGLILEEGMGRLDAKTRDEFEWYADSIGIDFTEIESDKRAGVAAWLLGVIDDLRGELGASFGWNTEEDKVHFDQLSELLRELLRKEGPISGQEE